jgi:hypothetical protein
VVAGGGVVQPDEAHGAGNLSGEEARADAFGGVVPRAVVLGEAGLWGGGRCKCIGECRGAGSGWTHSVEVVGDGGVPGAVERLGLRGAGACCADLLVPS